MERSNPAGTNVNRILGVHEVVLQTQLHAGNMQRKGRIFRAQGHCQPCLLGRHECSVKCVKPCVTGVLLLLLLSCCLTRVLYSSVHERNSAVPGTAKPCPSCSEHRPQNSTVHNRDRYAQHHHHSHMLRSAS